MLRNKLIFIPPTIDQIEAYFIEIGVQPAREEAEAMFWHYESNGWMVGRTRMSSWKGACQTWKRSPYRQARTQSQPNYRQNGNYAPTGQKRQQISYVKPNTEQGSPMPDELREGLFAGFGKLVSKLTGKSNDRSAEERDPSRDNPEAGQGEG